MRRQLAIVLVLAATPSFGTLTAPPATVPAPKTIRAAELPEPFGWPLAIANGIGAAGTSKTSLAFHVDLDLLAPLGNGPGNAATWFRDFAKPSGARLAEWNAAEKRRVPVKVLGVDNSVLPPNDPMLREAEPWVDQATCRFYPAIFPIRGPETAIPNLLMAMTLGRSWVARGLHDGNADDLRRTMRLGRLLRQDDVTLIQDLIAIALVRMAANAMYDLARSRSDTLQTTLASLVVGECNAIRLETTNRSHMLHAEQSVDSGGFFASLFGPSSHLRSEDLDGFIAMARDSADRRFRFEALSQVDTAKHMASGELKEKAAKALKGFETDRDPLIAADARWYAAKK